MDDDQNTVPDLLQILAGSSSFPADPQALNPNFLNMRASMVHGGAANTTGVAQRQVLVSGGRSLVTFACDHSIKTTQMDIGAGYGTKTMAFYGGEVTENVGASGDNSRWSRQETVILLEIRSRLDPKFKEVNHKGPLWDEVSRIMSEEYGYNRSGKKCREKFENLYKYYKKTKEGKAGRPDGKHYRFFPQLESIYGDQTTNQPLTSLSPYCINLGQNQTTEEHLSFSCNHHSSESETCSSSSEYKDEYDDLSVIALKMKRSEEKRKRARGREAKVKEFVGLEMKKIVEAQEVWMERMLKRIEDREKERLCREEEWRKKEAARLDQEHESRAKERAWNEARDNELMKVMEKLLEEKGEGGSSSSLVEEAITNIIIDYKSKKGKYCMLKEPRS